MRLVDALTYQAKHGGKGAAVFDVVAARLVSVRSGVAEQGSLPRS
jgi:hypothetical protein